jgi:hypothetical protein
MRKTCKCCGRSKGCALLTKANMDAFSHWDSETKTPSLCNKATTKPQQRAIYQQGVGVYFLPWHGANRGCIGMNPGRGCIGGMGAKPQGPEKPWPLLPPAVAVDDAMAGAPFWLVAVDSDLATAGAPLLLTAMLSDLAAEVWDNLRPQDPLPAPACA